MVVPIDPTIFFFRKMSVPGAYTVQIYDNSGQAYVVGVRNKELQNEVILDHTYKESGEISRLVRVVWQ